MSSQEGSLCAQHCLNNLLQSPYFTAVDLAEIAHDLDETERQTMAEGGVQTQEYRNFLEQPSSNFDDSGFFSIQVLQKAVKIWNLELLTFTSQDPTALAAMSDPKSQKAFICNYREHWLCIRKLGHQWFNLNSLLIGPELLSDTYLSMFLTQLRTEGYSIFIVLGDLPDCEADQMLQLQRVTQPVKPHLISEELTMKKLEEEKASGSTQGLEYDLQQALMESHRMMAQEEDDELQAALSLSMQGQGGSGVANQAGSGKAGGKANTAAVPSPDVAGPSQDELRQKRLAFFNQKPPPPASTNGETSANAEEQTEEDLLAAAIKMSMETVPS